MSIQPPSRVDRTDIAIIGMSGRFPGAPNIAAFWQNVRNGVESRTIFPDEELKAAGIPAALLDHPKFVKSGFTLEDFDTFDATFFGINPREAEVLDPQHRLFLECAWEAVENAGYDPETYPGAVAVFGGSTFSGYLNNNVLRNTDILQAVGPRQAVYGSVPDYMVTRVSYKLNLKGPCYFVQSACSTSLVAVHLGCQSLNNHESDLVLAGGVSVMVPQRLGYAYEEGGMMSPDGVCRAFDSRAKGTVFGSGVGIVILKRLSDALADGDSIRAVIRGAATNNDGSLKVGFTAPSVTGQAQVVAEALANAGVEADSIGYVEAHGTGTELGDPIEIAALTRAYRASTERQGFCAVGSVKPNVGHLDAAAGVSSLIKTVLALEHHEVPPTINFEAPNPKIDFANSPFFVNTTLRPWPRNGAPRRAGVSSFGFGGTNAHLILEEAPPAEVVAPSRSAHVVLVSAKTESALQSASHKLAALLTDRPDLSLADVAFTSQVGRRPFAYRRAVVCGNTAQAVDGLEGRELRNALTGHVASNDRPVVFLFPGQGSQYVEMGLGLYREERVFREVVDECAAKLLPHIGMDLRKVLYPESGSPDEAVHRLRQTSLTQAALFVIELALAKQWMQWGVRPAACLGHSIGEFVAACVSGVLNLDDALRLVARRGQLMEEAPRGVMLAVPLDEARLRRYLGPGVWLAADNAPGLCVVSVETEVAPVIEERLRRDGVESRRLHTSHAFHSGLMDGAVRPFVDAVQDVAFGSVEIPYISNVTGTWIKEAQATDPEYWGTHIRESVRFSAGVTQLLKDDYVFLEVGPGNTLSTLVRQHLRQTQGTHVVVSSLRHAQEQGSDVSSLVSAAARLWVSGAALDWKGFHADEQRRRVPLPSYPFERHKFWIEPDKFSVRRMTKWLASRERTSLDDWFQIPCWKRAFAPSIAPGGLDPAVRETAVVFLDEAGLATRIADRLEEIGHDVIRVDANDNTLHARQAPYAIRPDERADYVRLFKDLQAQGKNVSLVVHCWGVTNRPEPMPERDASARYQDRGFFSLLHLAQALGELGGQGRVRINIVADGIHDVIGDEQLVPEKATVLGPSRVIPQEFANVSCRTIDLRIGASAALSGDEFDAVVADLLQPSVDVDIAYRRGRRWVLEYVPFPIKEVPAERHSILRQQGVYLITGGLGEIGLVLGSHLAKTLRARLVLTARRGVPDRAEWPAYLAAHGVDEATSRRIRAVQALEAAGAEVMIAQADVSSEADMRRVVEAADARFGRIDGVIHSAGIAGGGMIQLKQRDVATAVLAPKVDGTRVLAKLFQNRQLDFMLLCSSLTSVLGGVGQVDYCGANAYLDAFARQYSADTGTFAVSVNWNAWREGGMAVNTDVPKDLKDALKDQMLQSGISNDAGVDAFRRILEARTERQIAIFPYDVQSTLETARGTDDTEAEEAVVTVHAQESVPAVTKHQRPPQQTAYVAPRSDAEQKICRVWQDLLGIDQVGIHDNFFDLGGHSLLAIRVMARVNEELGTEVPVARLYEGLTVAFLAGIAAPAQEQPGAGPESDLEEDAERREKARRMKEHQQQRRRVAMRR